MSANRYELKYIIQTKNISKLMESFGKILTPDKNKKITLDIITTQYISIHTNYVSTEISRRANTTMKPRIRLYRNVTDFEVNLCF